MKAPTQSKPGMIARALGALFGRPRPGAQYMRGERSPTFFGWHPVLRDARDDVRAAYWRASARAIDMIQNSGWIAGVIRRAVATVMGTELRLALKPDFEALGWTQEFSAEWARKVERRWEAWAANPLECDAAGVWNIHQQAAAALRSYFAAGEWVAEYPFIARSQSKTRTKVQLIPAYRLTQETNGVDLFQGVRVDRHGMPLSYRFRLTQPIVDPGEVLEIAARDAANRPRVVHTFEGDISQMRGISPFTPVLERTKQYDQLSGATLQTAIIQSIFAATVTSPSPTQEILGALQSPDEQQKDGDPTIDTYFRASEQWYKGTNIDLGGVSRMAHLFPGEKLEFMRSETPNSNYEPFARFLLREIAACAGFTTEDMTGDYNGATYSSIRMSTTTNWPIQLWRRKHIVAPFYQSAFECWLEEDIERGMTPFPGGLAKFLAFRNEACKADWRGPPKPQADDLKWTAATEKQRNMGVVTDEQICAEMGTDWEDVYEQRAREKQRREDLKLADPIIAGSTIADADTLDEDEGDQDETGDDKGDKKPGDEKNGGKDKQK
jgi:lambda family phage portal protein